MTRKARFTIGTNNLNAKEVDELRDLLERLESFGIITELADKEQSIVGQMDLVKLVEQLEELKEQVRSFAKERERWQKTLDVFQDTILH